VKTKNRYYDMRAVLAQLQFNVVKFERNEIDGAESKVYLAKPLPAELVRGHRSVRTVVRRSSPAGAHRSVTGRRRAAGALPQRRSTPPCPGPRRRGRACRG
jgi:hypothetical protein